MKYHYFIAAPGSDAESDFKNAMELNFDDIQKLVDSPTYHTLPSNEYERRNILFSAMYRHWCGSDKYTGTKTKYIETDEDKFKAMYCPKILETTHKLDRETHDQNDE